MYIRKTAYKDFRACVEIYKSAREFMRENGNGSQWKATYPPESLISDDIKCGISYVCEDRGEIVAVFVFGIGNEKCYDKIYDGNWLNSDPYAYIHRVAVKYHGRGIAKECLDFCFENYKNLKIDTHENNLPMQRLLEKCNFEKCGIVYLENGEKRIAFQKSENSK